jgi:hypothetical protein
LRRNYKITNTKKKKQLERPRVEKMVFLTTNWNSQMTFNWAKDSCGSSIDSHGPLVTQRSNLPWSTAWKA